MFSLWDQKLSVGIKEIDDRHRQLLGMLNKLRIAMTEGQGKAEIGKMIVFLEDYVVTHFNEEEQIMEQHQYPYVNEHKQAHQVFIKELAELKEKLRVLDSHGNSTTNLAVYLERRLSDWFIDHIGSKDRKLASFMSSRA